MEPPDSRHSRAFHEAREEYLSREPPAVGAQPSGHAHSGVLIIQSFAPNFGPLT